MAGDWIKWTKGLPDKPEVIRIAGLLRLPREVVACRLMRLWEWCDDTIPDEQIRPDGTGVIEMSPVDGDNAVTADTIAGAPGLANALVAVGWVRFEGGALLIQNFGRHNGETAKTRARNTKNQNKVRNGRTGRSWAADAPGVTEVSPPHGDKTVTREEERREEKKEDNPQPPSGESGQQGPRKREARAKTDPAAAVPIPAELDCPKFRAVWADWLACRAAQGKRQVVTERAAKIQLKNLTPLGIDGAVACVEYSIANNYQGLIFDRFQRAPPTPPTAPPAPARPTRDQRVQAMIDAEMERMTAARPPD